MGRRIIICGLNGAGKSTLGKALAKKLDLYFIDHEDLFFPKTDPRYIYASPRTREEAGKLFLNELQAHKNFVLASVKGDYGESVSPVFEYAILIDVPKKIRIRRVENRSFQKFGKRMLPGGDLNEQEKGFLNFVKLRNENAVEEWVQSLKCPVIRIDGTKPVEEIIKLVIEQMQI